MGMCELNIVRVKRKKKNREIPKKYKTYIKLNDSSFCPLTKVQKQFTQHVQSTFGIKK